MNVLTAERAALAAELTAAGVPATTRPGEVLGLVVAHSVAALVGRGNRETLGFGSATVELEMPVTLVTAGPDDDSAAERLDAALLLALPVVQPLEPVTLDTWDAADTDMPAKHLTARRRIALPTP